MAPELRRLAAAARQELRRRARAKMLASVCARVLRPVAVVAIAPRFGGAGLVRRA